MQIIGRESTLTLLVTAILSK